MSNEFVQSRFDHFWTRDISVKAYYDFRRVLQYLSMLILLLCVIFPLIWWEGLINFETVTLCPRCNKMYEKKHNTGPIKLTKWEKFVRFFSAPRMKFAYHSVSVNVRNEQHLRYIYSCRRNHEYKSDFFIQSILFTKTLLYQKSMLTV